MNMLKRTKIIRQQLFIMLIEVLIYWRNHKNKYNNVDNSEKRVVVHKDKILYFLIVKINYMIFLILIENLGNCITTDLLVHQFLFLCPERKNNILDSLYHIIYSFMKLHYLTLRESTHIIRLFPKILMIDDTIFKKYY